MAKHLNVEIKATCANLERAREILVAAGAYFHGTDNQTDTYFNSANGRLKLRQGNIENALIFYQRDNSASPKGSQVNMMQMQNGPELRSILADAMGILVEVKKSREIFFIDNVKFHLDAVDGLGTFVEIEAIDKEGNLGEAYLRNQCLFYMQMLGITTEHLLTNSYSDMLIQLAQ